ncbi:MAG: 5-deoxy-glucuronate isomerase [Firmicutes bacterium]|nr:5-deoxy-glucuronate isomerase [Bacillota bacterium]
MSLLRRYSCQEGYTPIVEGEMERIGFGLLSLGEDGSYRGQTGDKEAALIVLTGTCTVEGEGFCFAQIGERLSVFAGKPYAVFLPADTAFEIRTTDWAEIAVCTSPSDVKTEPVLVRPDDVIHKKLGHAVWERDAYFIIDDRVPAKSLYIGETILAPGRWAFPPHTHDVDDPPYEVDMEEVYFYRVRPSDGFGLQMVYTQDRSIDDSYIVRENDTVLIPKGYHPAAASPGNALYILWIMAGEKRLFLSRPEERYAWTVNC